MQHKRGASSQGESSISHREPIRGDFKSEKEFGSAWEKWRHIRDQNNAAVKRSRTKRREAGLGASQDQLEKSQSEEIQLLKELLRKVLSNAVARTQLTPQDWVQIGLAVAH